MTPAAITLTVFLIALALFIADFLPMGLMVFMVPMALYFCGVVEAKEIFAPLIGQSIILVVAMSVLGAALFKTGMAEKIGRGLFRFCPGERSLMMAVTLFAGAVSSFVSNTGTVAILIPIIMGAAASHKINPSRLLIPLTAGATLGGNISEGDDREMLRWRDERHVLRRRRSRHPVAHRRSGLLRAGRSETGAGERDDSHDRIEQ